MPKFDVREENQKWWVYIDNTPYRSFATKEEALTEMARLQKLLSNKTKCEELNGHGKVLDFSPDGWWIQNRGKSFAVLPLTDLDLKIGEIVQVDKSGNVKMKEKAREKGGRGS